MRKIYIKQLCLFAVFLGLLPGTLSAQKECGFDRMLEQAKAQNPYFEQARHQVEAFTKQYAASARPRSMANVVIPTVVHVVHNGEAVGTYPNMSDAQLLSAMNNLNQAFKNTAPYAGTSYYNNPMNIEFALAKVSPGGASSTGIERHNVSSKSYASAYANNGISSAQPGGPHTGVPQATLFADYLWNPQDYMNIWIVKKIDGIDTGSGSSGTLGYATIPLSNPGTTDGLVCQARAFGYYENYDHNNRPADFDFGPSPSHLNGTADHEVGHYLNLYHTFSGDNNGTQCPSGAIVVGTNDDGCDDIPRHKRTDSACPSYSATGNDCVAGGGPTEYIHNFMNYSTDMCFQGFSSDQKTRCEAAVNGPRSSFKTAIGHLAPSGSFPAAIAANVTNVNVAEGIGTVTLAGASFTSHSTRTDGGYLDRTASQPTVQLAFATQYTMTVAVGPGSTLNNEIANVYIDFNGDNSFNETDERIFQAVAGTGKNNGDAFSFTFTTPAATAARSSAPPANQRLRMRVISDFDNNVDAISTSATTSGGQIEDYSVRFSSVVPVELNAFEAKAGKKSITLYWSTSLEVNNDGFEIQRSENNSDFETIDFVQGAGNSRSSQLYSYEDRDVTPGQLYLYRLNQKDFDGQQELSRVVSARVSGTEIINVYPNPASTSITIAHEKRDRSLGYEMFTTIGQLVLSSTTKKSSHQLSVAHLPRGNYYIRIKTSDNVTTVKKIVLGL